MIITVRIDRIMVMNVILVRIITMLTIGRRKITRITRRRIVITKEITILTIRIRTIIKIRIRIRVRIKIIGISIIWGSRAPDRSARGPTTRAVASSEVETFEDPKESPTLKPT